MLTIECHCAVVKLQVATTPEEITECNCSLCRRYGVLWAYYEPDMVEMPDAALTEAYVWGARTQAFHRCKKCGCFVFSVRLPQNELVGLNARLFSPGVLASARLRHLDGAWEPKRYLD